MIAGNSQNLDVLYYASLYKCKRMGTLGKDELRKIETACVAFEKELQKAQTALAHKNKAASEQRFAFTCYSTCKILIASEMAKQQIELALAYLKKALLTLSYFPALQLHLIKELAETCGNT